MLAPHTLTAGLGHNAHSLTAGLGRDAARGGWCAHSLTAGLARDTSRAIVSFFFARAPSQCSLTRRFPGRVVFFRLLAPCPDAHSLTAPGPRRFPGRVMFSFCSRPAPAPTLTHSLRAWPAMLPGPLCFFCSRPAPTLTHSLRAWAATLPGPGGSLFCSCLPGHSLTHCGRGALFCSRPAPTLTGPGPRRFPGRVVFCFCSGLAEPGEPLTKSVWFATSDLTLGPKP